MQFVNIHEAKTHLSHYLEQVTSLHQPIVICRNGKPIAQLVEYREISKRKSGILKGKIKMEDDFDQLPSEFIEHFE
jgi:prevent-host-death family protein